MGKPGNCPKSRREVTPENQNPNEPSLCVPVFRASARREGAVSGTPGRGGGSFLLSGIEPGESSDLGRISHGQWLGGGPDSLPQTY